MLQTHKVSVQIVPGAKALRSIDFALQELIARAVHW